MIHQSAIVLTHNIGERVRIDPYSVIASDVIIGHDVVIHSHVVIESGVVIGDRVEIFPGAYLGKEPKGAGALARQPVFEKRIEICDDVSIGPHAVIYFDVKIGKNCLIGDAASVREQCIIGNASVVGRHVTVNYNTTIGSHVKIMDHAWLAGNMIIEDNVFISGGVLTTNDNKIGQSGYEESQIIGPHIREFAAIGAGAILLPNIVIGRSAIVGAGSVVTRSISDNTLVIGSPARAKNSSEVKEK